MGLGLGTAPPLPSRQPPGVAMAAEDPTTVIPFWSRGAPRLRSEVGLRPAVEQSEGSAGRAPHSG